MSNLDSKATFPAIGTAMEGGFFGGIINVNGFHKGVIWSPKREGQINSVLLSSSKTIQGAGSANDCTFNMLALLDAGSPAAIAIAEMKINGFEDWVIPSRDVLELGYRHFKPTDQENFCSWRDGENANSVPPGWLYSETDPSQVAIQAFQSGGDEAFDDAWHWSSTVLPSGRTAFGQYFGNGTQGGDFLSAELRVRAVRLIQLSS